MKTATPALISFLNSAQNAIIADLFTFELLSGTTLRYTSLDVDVTYNGNTWAANAPVIEREKVRSVVGIEVDTMKLTVSPRSGDMIDGVPWIAAVRSGALDGARVTLRRAYFDRTTQQFLRLPGTSGNYASTPDSVANSVTGDIDIRVKVAMDDWTPSTARGLVVKRGNGAGQYAWQLIVNISGTIEFTFTQDGSTHIAPGASAAPSLTDGAAYWIRASRLSASGLVSYYKSSDGSTWEAIGTASGTTGAMFDSASVLELGSTRDGTTNNLVGKVYYAEVRNGIDGTVVARFDADEAALGATSFESSTGEVWTINSTGTPPNAYIFFEPKEPQGVLTMFAGRVGASDGGRTTWNLEVRSDLDLLNIQMPRNLVQPPCLHTLFDTGCSLVKASFATPGAVAAGSTKTQINCGLVNPTDFFTQGTITFLTGPNAGVSRSIKRYLPGLIVLIAPLPNTPIVGDTFEAFPGCDKRLTTCDTKFNNKVNFRGMPFVPKPEAAV